MSEDREVEFEVAEVEAEVLEDAEVKNLAEPEPTSEVVEEVVEVAPTPVSIAPKRKSSSSAKSSAVESKIGSVEVVLSALTYQASSRNSASVRVLQDRLAELGHGSVRLDRQGWLSDGTVEALREFQTEAGLEATGVADSETVEAVLRGTKAKVV